MSTGFAVVAMGLTLVLLLYGTIRSTGTAAKVVMLLLVVAVLYSIVELEGGL